jgi:predicted  nucleic acid-binding Zn-ribbon protein
MSDAPEKIWAWNTANCDGDWTIAEGQGIEYTRTDISQAKIDEAKNQLDSARHSVTVLEERRAEDQARIAELEVALLATERALRVYGAKPDFYRAALRQAQAALKVKP